jgi:hypothetical protein
MQLFELTIQPNQACVVAFIVLAAVARVCGIAVAGRTCALVTASTIRMHY